MTTVAILSFRLGCADGVSVEAATWAWAFGRLGLHVRTVAGEGVADHIIPGLAIASNQPPGVAEVEAALAGADVVVVENLLSLPLNPGATTVVAAVVADRPAILRHHDLAWQRSSPGAVPPPPDNPCWAHVTINDLSRHQLVERGVSAVTVRNAFDPDPVPGDRDGTRRRLGLAGTDRLVVQPTRALPRKDVAGAIALAEALGATYWLLGPAEDGYGPELARLLAAARVPVLHGLAGATVADAYAAADVVAFPSTWEGFGNPVVESALHRRPLAMGSYPVAEELARFGFRWFDARRPASLETWLRRPDADLLDHNQAVAREHFSRDDLPAKLAAVMGAQGWAVP